MDTSTKDRRWVFDALAIAIVMAIWLIDVRSSAAEAVAAGRAASVSLAIPALVLVYVSYRVGRRFVKGSAYPPKRKSRSFRLERH